MAFLFLGFQWGRWQGTPREGAGAMGAYGGRVMVWL